VRQEAQEDFFKQRVLDTSIEEKKFNKSNDECTDTKYGKIVFVTLVVSENAANILLKNYILFLKLFQKLLLIIIKKNS